MTREQLDKLILKTYGICADYPFKQDCTTGVFRHSDTGKWFAISMCIRARKLALDSEAMLDVVNLKCAPEVIESLAGSETGIFPAYHMKKAHWLTVVLDLCDAHTLAWLLSISYDLTKSKAKRKTEPHTVQ